MEVFCSDCTSSMTLFTFYFSLEMFAPNILGSELSFGSSGLGRTIFCIV